MTAPPPAGFGRRHPLLRRVVYAVALVYAVATVVALAAWWLVGDTWWTQPINLTTFWWTLPAVGGAPIAFVLGRRALAVALLVPAIAWLWSYGTAFVHPGAQEPPPATLRVATFNTYVGVAGIDHVVDLVERHEPDVLLLQEVFGDREDELTAALGERYPTQVYVPSPGVGAVAVLTRYDLLDARDVVDAGERTRATRVLVLDIDGTAVQVVPLHLLSPCPACGTSLLERLELEGDVRRAEIATVVAALDPDLPAVVGGDLNSNDRSEPYRRLVASGFRDPHRERGSGMGFTWPEGGTMPPWLRIDWLLVRGLEPVDAFVADGGGSDHRPVVVDLAVPQGSED